MDPKIAILFLITSADFLIALISYFQNKKSPSNRAYALFAFVVSMWGLSLGLFLWLKNTDSLDLLARIIYFSGGSIAPAFYYFTKLFQSEREKPSLKKHVLAPVALIFVLYFFSNLILQGYTINHDGLRGYSYGPLWFLFDIYLYGFFTLALYELFKKYHATADDSFKIQITYITLGTYIVLPIATATNIVGPYLGYINYLWVGPATTIIWVILVTYAMAKHNLLNIKIIATEIFVALITIILFADVFLSSSTTEFLIKFMVLVLTIFLEILLVRSVLKEVQTRQQIEQLAGQLQAANTELARINQAKSDFISMASHQLKTPLSIIKGYVSMTLEGSFGSITKKTKEQLEKVFISNERLISLVEDLLNLSRVEAGRMKYDWTEQNISDIVQQVVEEVRMAVEGKHLKLIWKQPVEKLYVHVDLNKMRNVIFNMMDNAIKYTDKGSITVTVVRHNQSAQVSVTDTGRGISAPQIQKLFTKFTRVIEGKNNLTTIGFGLGLYVARLIVEEHKGRVWAESAGLGKGSTFVLELPLSDKKLNIAENLKKQAKSVSVEQQKK